MILKLKNSLINYLLRDFIKLRIGINISKVLNPIKHLNMMRYAMLAIYSIDGNAKMNVKRLILWGVALMTIQEE